MFSYKVRIDVNDRSVKECIDLIVKNCDTYAYVYEEKKGGQNPHMHFFVRYEVSSAECALRTRLRRFGFKGNKDYSVGRLDNSENEDWPLEYLGYLTKEGEVLWYGIPKEIIEKAKEYALKVQAEMKEKKSKQTQFQICEIYLLENYPQLKEKLYIVNHDRVTELVIECYRKKGILVREFQLVAIVQTLLLKYDPYYGSKLKCRIMEKLT